MLSKSKNVFINFLKYEINVVLGKRFRIYRKKIYFALNPHLTNRLLVNIN